MDGVSEVKFAVGDVVLTDVPVPMVNPASPYCILKLVACPVQLIVADVVVIAEALILAGAGQDGLVQNVNGPAWGQTSFQLLPA